MWLPRDAKPVALGASIAVGVALRRWFRRYLASAKAKDGAEPKDKAALAEEKKEVARPPGTTVLAEGDGLGFSYVPDARLLGWSGLCY